MRPIWVAEELELPYVLMPIGPRTGETKTPEYTSMNPKQKIPFLEDGDFRLSESFAICRHLVRKYGSTDTLMEPASAELKAQEDEWLSFIYGELDETSLYVIRRHGALANIYGEAPEAISAAREYVARQLAVVSAHIQDKHYLMDERFTLADLFLTTCLDWVIAYELDLPSNLQSYHSGITNRPAYGKARQVNQAG